MATTILLGSCQSSEVKDAKTDSVETKPLIGRSDIKIEDGRMTPEALWAMGASAAYKYRRMPGRWYIRWLIIAYRRIKVIGKSS